MGSDSSFNGFTELHQQVKRTFTVNEENQFGRSEEISYGQMSVRLLNLVGDSATGELVTLFVTYDIKYPVPSQGAVYLSNATFSKPTQAATGGTVIIGTNAGPIVTSGAYPFQITDDMSGLVGRLSFGNGGTSQDVKFDIVRGMYLSVPATTLQLAIDYPQMSPTATGPNLIMKAMAGYGQKGNYLPPQLTVPLGVVSTASGGVIVQVPNLATRVRLVSDIAPDLDNYELTQLKAPLPFAGVLSTHVFPFATDADNTVALLNGCQGILVQNLNPATVPHLNLIFYLAL